MSDPITHTYKYLRFHWEPGPVQRKTGIYSCRNKTTEAELGKVKWYGPWHQYCYFPIAQAVYSRGCLRDIADFIEGLS